ncbi:MAG: hypothetical protein U5R06_10810 [candidate division KSB1 bacterium]|nr:hypothetical protein [candidate division KSB1 bacterium]
MLQSWNKIKKRFTALWNNEIIDRCCVRVVARKNNQHYQAPPLPEKYGERVAYWLDGERILARETERIEKTYFAGESFPLIFSNFGAAGHAAFFKGIEIDFQDSIWMRPAEPVESGMPFTVEYNPESLLLKKNFEVMKYLVDESRGRFMISMPDISGNLDALAHLRQSDNLLMDMALQPQVVQKALKEIMQVWKSVTPELYSLIRENNDRGSTIGWLDTWAPGLHAQMQCDISVMISPDMYETFAVPELEEQSEFLDYPLYHLDGAEQVRHLDHMLSLENLKMIQWTNVAGQPSPVEFIPVLQRIQQADKSLLVRVSDVKDIEPLMTSLSSKGLYIYVEPMLESENEADDIVKLVENLTHD